MKYLIAIAALVCLSACEPVNVSPQFVQSTGSSTVITGKYEDCTIYHTKVEYYSDVSWVRCEKKPKVITTSHIESCGKNCSREVITQTLDESK